ncbi:MAG: DUF3800 domain-containing protein [Verrucomicrobia bacterium]|nr:DUF3800 domain-containing protein [Verrucomicrobiota bacterium]
MKNSDYIVFVDESGDHSLDSINQRYPIFVLSFCVFQKETYIREISPALGMLKLSLFGHDTIVFHEHEIRKKEGAFNKLSKEQREELLQTLNIQITQANFTLIPIVVDKATLKKSGMDTPNVYHLAMQYGLELLHQYLNELEQHNLKTHVIFEARGKAEDLALEVEFRRVCDYQNFGQRLLPFEIVIADKKTNSCGLQFADLTARPVGLSVLRPDQPNRAFEILRGKLYHKLNHFDRQFVFPIKAKSPEVVLEAQRR